MCVLINIFLDGCMPSLDCVLTMYTYALSIHMVHLHMSIHMVYLFVYVYVCVGHMCLLMYLLMDVCLYWTVCYRCIRMLCLYI